MRKKIQLKVVCRRSKGLGAYNRGREGGSKNGLGLGLTIRRKNKSNDKDGR